MPATLSAHDAHAHPVLPARALAAELHDLLNRIEPAVWSDARASEVRARTASIQGHLSALLPHAEPGAAAALAALEGAITAALPDGTAAGSSAAWVRFSHHIHPAYESLLRAVAPEAASGRSLRPTNYARNVFHMLGATGVMTVIHLLPDRASMIAVALSVTVPAWTIEGLRRSNPRLNDWMMWLFGPVAHAHERFRVNSASWYAAALTLLAFVSPVPAALLGVAVLGFGDPFAAIVGRRFGRTPIRTGRTLEGSLAFVGAAWIAGVITLALAAPDLPNAAITALVAAVCGAVAELYSQDVDDNLTIPLAAALGAAVTMGASGAL